MYFKPETNAESLQGLTKEKSAQQQISTQAKRVPSPSPSYKTAATGLRRWQKTFKYSVNLHVTQLLCVRDLLKLISDLHIRL